MAGTRRLFTLLPRSLSRRDCLRGAIHSGLVLAGVASSHERVANARVADTNEVAAARAQIWLQPLGPMSNLELDFVARALRGHFDVDVARLPEQPLPHAAFYPPRRRYRADRLLTLLLGMMGPQRGGRILGVTAADISTTKEPYADWGIMGLATIAGRSGIISSFRCKRRAPTPVVATTRLGKTAVHEMGHSFGLEHCPNAGCLMEAYNGSVLTNDRASEFCARCRDRLKGFGFPVKPTPFRWDPTTTAI